MKYIISLLLTLPSSFAFVANASVPKPDVTCSCAGDACHQFNIYKIGEKKDDYGISKTVVKIVRVELSDEAPSKRLYGFVENREWSLFVQDLTNHRAASFDLVNSHSFGFGASLTGILASVEVSGGESEGYGNILYSEPNQGFERTLVRCQLGKN